MRTKSKVSKQTRNNWIVDAVLITSGILAGISGIYFLFFVRGGYRGGRNPLANVSLVFDRHTWNDIHTWAGIAMILIAAIHLIIHWSWFISMLRRMLKEIRGQVGHMNPRGRWNLVLNLVVGASFLLTALSGIYFLFTPHGPGASGYVLIFSRTTWDLFHTWAGVTLILAAVIHFAIHWRWVTKVTNKLANSFSLEFNRTTRGRPPVVVNKSIQ